MCFLIEFRVKLIFVRSVRLNAILLLSKLISLRGNKLIILSISSLDRVELLWLKRITRNLTLLIVTIQELLIYLLLVFSISLTLVRRTLSRVSLTVLLTRHIGVLRHLRALLGWVYYLRKVSLSPNLLCVQLRWGLVLLILRTILW